MSSVNIFFEIPMEDILVSDPPARKNNRKAGLDQLAESIEKHGLLQPVVLRGEEGTPPYELIVGQRRFLAHKRLKRKTIRAVFAGSMDDEQALLLSLAENVHRVELNFADKAKAITALFISFGRDVKKTAEALGLHPNTIRDYIKIEELMTPKMKALLKSRKISKEDIKRALASSRGNAEKADALVDELRALSKYEKERAVGFGRDHQNASVEEIVQAAITPRIQKTIILNISGEISTALRKARKQLAMENEYIATVALEDWLKKKRIFEVINGV